MRVKFFGVRGSVPTPGPSTVRYGGNSVCVEVTLGDGTRIILDAGTGIRECGKQLTLDEYRGKIHIFITHGHWDHIIGLPFFSPIYRKETRIVMHNMDERGRAGSRRPVLFDGEHFPVRFSDLPATLERDDADHEHRVGSARISSIELNHPGGSTGFRIDDDEDGTSVCYLTDNELAPPGEPLVTPDELARFAHGTSLLIHDAQYLPQDMPAKLGWGHSLVDEVLALGQKAEARTVAFHHHDPDRDDDALDAIATHATLWAATHAPFLHPLVARESLTLDLATLPQG
jgi:phosphoribosyl 1,2-cyclic phosphodiesterase